MRDIRTDLTERLEWIREQRVRLSAQIKALEAEESHVKALIDIENRRLHSEATNMLNNPPLGTVIYESEKGPIRAFLEAVMSPGKPITLDELVAEAENRKLRVAPDKSLARTLHAALLGLKRWGRAEILRPGTWVLKKRDAPPAGTGEAPR